MNLDDENRGNAGLSVVWPIMTNRHFREELSRVAEGESPNNISLILRYQKAEGAKIMWMGDLESDFMEKIRDEVTLDRTDILFAPHHGRDSGTIPAEWLDQIQPKLIVIGEAPSEHLNYYDGYNKITQNSAWDITFECISGMTHVFVLNDKYSVDFLENENVFDSYGGKYIGTLR